jgi:hypothetical protein
LEATFVVTKAPCNASFGSQQSDSPDFHRAVTHDTRCSLLAAMHGHSIDLLTGPGNHEVMAKGNAHVASVHRGLSAAAFHSST